jgi:hypothetical protein
MLPRRNTYVKSIRPPERLAILRQLQPGLLPTLHTARSARPGLPADSSGRFKVLPPHPHRFDSDADGVGCESG